MPKSSRFAVFGIGRYGRQIALSLAAKGAEVFTFDSDPPVRRQSKTRWHSPSRWTQRTPVASAKRQDMDAAVVGDWRKLRSHHVDFDEPAGPGGPRVIVRSSGDHQKRILTSLGIREILTPESEVGSIVSERLIHPNIGGFLELPDDYEIAEIHAPQNCIGRTLAAST